MLYKRFLFVRCSEYKSNPRDALEINFWDVNPETKQRQTVKVEEMNWGGFGSVYHLPSILSLHLATPWKEVKWDSLRSPTLKDFSPLWEGLFVFSVKSCSPFFSHLIMFAGQKGWWIFSVEWNTCITDYLLSCLYCPHIQHLELDHL